MERPIWLTRQGRWCTAIDHGLWIQEVYLGRWRGPTLPVPSFAPRETVSSWAQRNKSQLQSTRPIKSDIKLVRTCGRQLTVSEPPESRLCDQDYGLRGWMSRTCVQRWGCPFNRVFQTRCEFFIFQQIGYKWPLSSTRRLGGGVKIKYMSICSC